MRSQAESWTGLHRQANLELFWKCKPDWCNQKGSHLALLEPGASDSAVLCKGGARVSASSYSSLWSTTPMSAPASPAPPCRGVQALGADVAWGVNKSECSVFSVSRSNRSVLWCCWEDAVRQAAKYPRVLPDIA